LPGRTEGQVKNRFYSHIKKKLLGDVEDDMSPEGQSTSPANEASGSPTYTGTQSPEHALSNQPSSTYTQSPTNRGPYQTPQGPFNGQPTNGYQNIHPMKVEMTDPNEFISYGNEQNGYTNGFNNNNFPSYNNGRQGVPAKGMYYQTPGNGYSESETSNDAYSNGHRGGDKDHLYDLSANQGSSAKYETNSPSSEPSDLSNLDKFNKMEELSKRKKQLEEMLYKTMLEIKNFDPSSVVQNGNMFHA